MGPIALFDKSFLQSLSVDESVWFDHFFLTNVCPLFYIETLADLEKPAREGRTPEQEVALIADKFPDMHGSPAVHHSTACIANLLGNDVPMTGQILLAGGQPVKTHAKSGIVFHLSPEAQAFCRWQRREFQEVERLYARGWRSALKALDSAEIRHTVRALGVDLNACTTLENARKVAENVVRDRERAPRVLDLAFQFFGVPATTHWDILHRWRQQGRPLLVDFAPYADFILTVELFFRVAVAAGLIGGERASNRIDIAYLHYLPFCMLFVSTDRLHARCASLFLRDDQCFVWGEELKQGLSELNRHYAQLPDSEKEKGVMSFAGSPPQEGEFYVARLWDRFFPTWRERKNGSRAKDIAADTQLLQEMKALTEAPPLPPEQVDFDTGEPDMLSVERRVRKRKGSWWQVPKSLKGSRDD